MWVVGLTEGGLLALENSPKDCGNTDGGDGYRSIAGREVVTMILVWWPEKGRRLAGNELKWQRRWG